jgi:hypothetical protein
MSVLSPTSSAFVSPPSKIAVYTKKIYSSRYTHYPCCRRASYHSSSCFGHYCVPVCVPHDDSELTVDAKLFASYSSKYGSCVTLSSPLLLLTCRTLVLFRTNTLSWKLLPLVFLDTFLHLTTDLTRDQLSFAASFFLDVSLVFIINAFFLSHTQESVELLSEYCNRCPFHLGLLINSSNLQSPLRSHCHQLIACDAHFNPVCP